MDRELKDALFGPGGPAGNLRAVGAIVVFVLLLLFGALLVGQIR